jgi:Na+-transporting methylmalonyl-CoA/oxaloacetate decarboxylase gamma subunit
MPKQFLMKATSAPLWFFAVCFALWFAMHSFFAALFVLYAAYRWIKSSIRKAIKEEKEASDATAAAPAAVKPQVETVQAAAATPIKRQYAKSPVVVPLKTGTDD